MQTMTANSHTLAPAAVFRTARPARISLRRIVTAFKVMNERAALARMSDEELADIGVTREEAAREAARPIWDLPADR